MPKILTFAKTFVIACALTFAVGVSTAHAVSSTDNATPVGMATDAHDYHSYEDCAHDYH